MRSAMETAARKLSSRSMTCRELENYLLGKGYSPEETKEVIQYFLDLSYLDDRRYCTEYFRYAFGKNRSKSRAFAELRQKGVDGSVIEADYDDYLDEEDDVTSEHEKAKAEAEKVLLQAGLEPEDPVPEKVRGRVARRLSGLGFGSSVIIEILDGFRR